MTIIVEDGSGKTDSNAYVSVADTDSYATLRNRTGWAALTTAQKEAAIVEASFYLDAQFIFLGTKVSAAQALSWPRSGVNDTIAGTAIPNNVVPINVRRSAMELAIKSGLGTTLLEDLSHGGQLSSESVGPISVSYKDNSPGTTLYMVTGLLKGLVRPEKPVYAPGIVAPSYAADQFFGPDQFTNKGNGQSTGGS